MSQNAYEETNCMQVEYVSITDGKFFTKERVAKWNIFIAKCCYKICERTINKVEPAEGVSYFLSTSLVREVVGDAVIGMSKIIDRTPHPVEEPNVFKIAAYLGYWFLRHKPVSIIYPHDVNLDEVRVASGCTINSKYLSWQLKHINEAVAVDIVTSSIFDFDKVICDNSQCENIKRKNTFKGNPCFVFDDFEHQRSLMTQKLMYYFTYRAIAPKIIEHILEGYAFHPAWGLTGAHWNAKVTGHLYEK